MIDRNTHIDWVDGAKGVSILSVILLHSLPCLREVGWMWHIGQAVPVFLFITAYLISTRFDSLRAYFTWGRFAKMIKKVFLPFVIVLAIQLICLALIDKLPSLKTLIKDGGIGPGSYYVWLYLQLWIIIPFIVWLVRKVPVWASALIMLVISVLTEYAFVSIEDIKFVGDVYRLMPVRYLMVLYLGCVWPILKDKQKYIFYGLAGISALLILNDVYFANTPPVELTPPFWVGYHWYTAFYVVAPIAVLERIRYTEVWKQAGKYSWYIFLLQMMCLGLLRFEYNYD